MSQFSFFLCIVSEVIPPCLVFRCSKLLQNGRVFSSSTRGIKTLSLICFVVCLFQIACTSEVPEYQLVYIYRIELSWFAVQSFMVVDCRRLSFSSCYCQCLERKAPTPHHICAIRAISFLQLSEDSPFPTFCRACEMTCVIIGHFNRFYYISFTVVIWPPVISL